LELGSVSQGLGALLTGALNLYMLAIVIYALMSWVSPDPYNPFVRFITSLCEPMLNAIRAFVPESLGVDISPMIAIVMIYLTKRVVAQALMQTGAG